jgi:pyrimidine operon attenuation protein / uracil phosphoribosyltransferase
MGDPSDRGAPATGSAKSPRKKARVAENPARVVMDSDQMARALRRIANEILERHAGAENLVLVGIRTRGVPLATRLADLIAGIEGHRPPVGAVDVTFYRDDFRTRAKSPEQFTELPFSVDDTDVILVDDVFFTGRTVRAAIDTVLDFGRPRTIQLAALIDRGHRELPFRADYVGKTTHTESTDKVRVHTNETDGVDRVLLIPKTEER